MPDGENLERRDGHGARTELDRLPRSCPRVRPATIYLDGAHGRRHLADVAAQRLDCGAQLRFGDGGETIRIGDAVDGAVGIVRRGRGAEPDGGEVLLVETHEEGEQAGGAAEPHHEEASGHGVEGSRMANPAESGEPPDPGDHVVTRHAVALVDEQDAISRGGVGHFSRLPTAEGSRRIPA